MSNEEIKKLFHKMTGLTWDITKLEGDRKEELMSWLIPDGKMLDNPDGEKAQETKQLMEELGLDISEKFDDESKEEPGGDEPGGDEPGGDNPETPETYTAEEAIAYNAALPGARKEGDKIDSNETVPYEYIHDEESWGLSAGNSVLKKYYEQYPDEDHWNTSENRAGNFNDKVYEVEIGNEVADFAAHWESDNVQKITKVSDDTEVYYLDMFYSLDEEEHALFTDAALSESAERVARFRKVKWNAETCPICWEGAVNAPGAKLPWVAINFDTDVDALVRFDYEGKDAVYPWGEDTLFGTGEGKKSWGLASPAKEFNDDTFALVANGGSDSFDGGNFKITLVHVVTAEEAIEYNANLKGAVKEGDTKLPSTAEIQG